MDRYFTVMVIPEREKGVRSFRIPRVVFHGLVFFTVIIIALLGILCYDYWKILQQVYENKHLTIENRQLKEQIQLFHMKLNALSDDIERVQTFEKKLRIITGLEERNMSQHLLPGEALDAKEKDEGQGGVDSDLKDQSSDATDLFKKLEKFENYQNNSKYLQLKELYEQKIATTFGLQTGYSYTKEWSDLTKQSFSLAGQFARFDYQFNAIKKYVETLEVDIHQLDQYLLDKDSFLKSTPTLLPAQGWITSYYGPRKSPFSGRVKMHEGLDIGARPGTSIIAPADGVVTFSGIKPGFGKFVQIDHGYGVESIFAHAQKLVIKKGELVKRGEVLAKVGNTGYSTGPHLHYEVRVNGTPVDPLYYILD